jgi:hypothetical protein
LLLLLLLPLLLLLLPGVTPVASGDLLDPSNATAGLLILALLGDSPAKQ